MISVMKPGEADAAIAVAAACFGPALAEDARVDFTASLADHPYSPKTFLYKKDGAVVGAVQSTASPITTNLRSITWLCVLPAQRGQGIGRALLQHAEQDAAETFFRGKPGTLILAAWRDPAYYAALGYAPGGTVHDGEPLMLKHISK